jgi:hypothetical protein
MDSRKRRLLEETEWTRVYRTSDNSISHESKLAADGLQVSAESIRARWPSMPLTEQLDFAGAFIFKGRLSEEDDLILQFLMENASEPVLAMVAYRVPELKDKERAMRFLLQGPPIEDRGFAANWYQALGTMHDVQALPFLWRQYERYRTALAPLEERRVWDLLDYTACLESLWQLDISEEPRAAITELLSHPDPEVRDHAQQFVFENKLQDTTRDRKPPAKGQVEFVKETDWSRIYCADNNRCWAVSKFREDPPEIDVGSLRGRWAGLPLEEKIEFAQAFCQKPDFTQQDLEIIDFLILSGPEYVRTSVGVFIRSRSDLEFIVSFLLSRAAAPDAAFQIYLPLLARVVDASILSTLRPQFEQYRRSLEPLESRGIGDLSGYFFCLGALRRAGRLSPDHDQDVAKLLQHPDPRIVREMKAVITGCGS